MIVRLGRVFVYGAIPNVVVVVVDRPKSCAIRLTLPNALLKSFNSNLIAYNAILFALPALGLYEPIVTSNPPKNPTPPSSFPLLVVVVVVPLVEAAKPSRKILTARA